MNEERKPPNILRILHDLQHMEDSERKPAAASELDDPLARLRTWQLERLAETYADLLSDPQFRPACLFFQSDVYAARDLSQRDRDFERLHTMLSRILPAYMLRLLKSAIELNRLSNDLDRALLDAIMNEFGVPVEITPQLYAEGYRICDNYEQRVYQIELLAKILREVGEGSHLPLVGISLQVARAPARRFGWFELHDFLMRGHTAFKQMRDVEIFVDTIRGREMRILKAIFAYDPDPFTLNHDRGDNRKALT